jgi:hypothetical protein
LTRPCRGAKPAGFIRDLDDEIVHLCAQVLFIRNAQGLIGREMSAIDGVKLPSNASKQRSGTRAEFARQAAKLEAQAARMLARHRASDACDGERLVVKSLEKAEPRAHTKYGMRRGVGPCMDLRHRVARPVERGVRHPRHLGQS